MADDKESVIRAARNRYTKEKCRWYCQMIKKDAKNTVRAAEWVERFADHKKLHPLPTDEIPE